MKIKIGKISGTDDCYEAVVETSREVELEGVYNGIGIPTDQGYIGIAQRDAGIEVCLDGKLIWSSVHGDMTNLAGDSCDVTKCDPLPPGGESEDQHG